MRLLQRQGQRQDPPRATKSAAILYIAPLRTVPHCTQGGEIKGSLWMELLHTPQHRGVAFDFPLFTVSPFHSLTSSRTEVTHG